MRAALVTTALALLIALSAVAPSEAAARPAALAPATVSVDFADRRGVLRRSERYNNYANENAFIEQRSADARFLNEQGLHQKVHRVWLDYAFEQCSIETGTCDFSGNTDAYLTDAGHLSDSVLVNLNPDEFIRGERPLKDLQPLLEVMLGDLKKKYPAVKYVEVFNEPDWKYHGHERHDGRPADEVTLRPGDLYRFYAPFYKAANEVDEGVRPADRLQIGGPAISVMDPEWMKPFLDDYAADRDPHKRLDFISYHAYMKWDDDYQVPTFYKSDLRQVSSERGDILTWLRERRIRGRVPSFITETGIYPGPSYDDRTGTTDYLRQAAGMATYNYVYSRQPDTYMFNWVVRHFAEGRKDQLVTRVDDGPVPTGIFTPYGNMMLMQSKMKDIEVSATVSGSREDDNGVYAIASKDRTGASLMVWNWQHTNDRSHRATIHMSRLPRRLGRGPVRLRMFRIDQTTSNYFTDPAGAGLRQVSDEIVRPGAHHDETIDLKPNACTSSSWNPHDAVLRPGFVRSPTPPESINLDMENVILRASRRSVVEEGVGEGSALPGPRFPGRSGGGRAARPGRRAR
ncbi:hypothetical protein BJF79_15610 [Actinomadura sp. CNU-125]|nr:hypothetical protein BJF79_15610 [Actinomadura sp. CNU-125]